MSDDLEKDPMDNVGPGPIAEAEAPQGELYVSLGRSNSQIRKERGDAIAEDLEVRFRRSIEDLETDIKRKERDLKNMYDFSPNSTTSLVLAKNVDAKEIQEADHKISFELRDMRIKLDIKRERYIRLFGKKI